MKLLSRVGAWFGVARHDHHGSHRHGHAHHGHTHGVIDATIATTDKGIFAIKWSFLLLAVTAALQLAVVGVSGSVALLADTIHNIADATTAIPLWLAFMLARRKPTPTFTYGYGRAEDFAGLAIVLIIFGSAAVAGYEAVSRLIHPQPTQSLGWVALAGLIGFFGNEAVAVFRIRIGRELESAALVADGYHARTDGLTSLAVVAGAGGVWLGYPLADPMVGLLITLAIFGIVWQSAVAVLRRMLDGIEPNVMGEIRHAAEHVEGIQLHGAKARWLGHRLHADISAGVDPRLPVSEAIRLGETLKKQLAEHMPAIASVSVSFTEAK